MLKAKLICDRVNNSMRQQIMVLLTVARFENSLLKDGTYPSAFSSLSSSLKEDEDARCVSEAMYVASWENLNMPGLILVS